MTLNSDPLSVLIIEDDFATRRHLKRKLEEGDALVVEAVATVTEALGRLQDAGPDVLLVDLGLPDGSGIDIITAASQLADPPEILVLSSMRDEASVVAAIAAGAGGYVVKDASAEDIVSTVRMLVNGCSPLSPSIARFILRSFRNGRIATEPVQSIPQSFGLTAREKEVLTEITRGASYRQIAARFEISEATVQTHIKSIYRKLGVTNRSEASFKLLSFGRTN